MSEKARKHIKEAVKAHLVDDGASELGKYRDVVLEVLHLAYKDRKVTKGKKDLDTRSMLKDMLLTEAFSGFEEEITNNEINKICKISKENLPLHLNDTWETEDGHQYFNEKIKETQNGCKKTND